jgi:predicted nuclease with RNAse H fold
MVKPQMRRAFRTFIGVDLGGGKGKTTAVARLRLGSEGQVVVDDFGVDRPWYDDRLIKYLLRHAEEAVLAIDAPLTLPACVCCTVPVCPGTASCTVPAVRWMMARGAERGRGEADKPAYTPYTQRATEVLLHEEHGILPRETLGQGMGPLTARAAHLVRALAGSYRLNENLLEVYPKATLTQLFPDPEAAPGPPGISYRDASGNLLSPKGGRLGSQVARQYKRSGHAHQVREEILGKLPGLRFGPGQWREFAVQSDHQLDAVLCAYTAYLWARDGWELPRGAFAEDGWIWFPPRP